MATPLRTEALRRPYDGRALAFETTADIPECTRIIGQPRGVAAISFGLGMRSAGYNLYAAGDAGTGRTTSITRFIEQHARDASVPADYIYVHNFAEPHRPRAIQMPPGAGCRFRDALDGLIAQLRETVAEAFDKQAYRDAALEIQHTLEARQDTLFTALQAEAAGQGASLTNTPDGFAIVPLHEGRPVPVDQVAELDEPARQAWPETHHQLQHRLNEVVHEARKMRAAAREEMTALRRRVAGSVVDGALEEAIAAYQGQPALIGHLRDLHQDILDHVDLFQRSEENDTTVEPEHFRRYQVNVIVDHRRTENAPVVVEYDPTIPRLLGRIEHEARHGGAIVTDFTMLRGGALHAANGGYLVLRARDLFHDNGAWDALKRALVGGVIRPDDPAARHGAAIRSLEPEPIPLDLKVVLIGPAGLYYHLLEVDEDFTTLFKVLADFDASVDRIGENEMEYARFVATRCHEERLRHFDRDAVGRVVEYGARLAGTQNKLSTRFGHIADIVREADYWAGVDGRDLVMRRDVIRAIENRLYLRGRLESLQREHLLTGKQLVAVAGTAVGQVNGLYVREVGGHAFGHVSRVTARAYVGREGVVQIDREVELAGPLHNKGVMTLVGYLGGRFAADVPLALAAQITFEQNYGGVDGDSASSTELYALLSTLAAAPIYQGIAVTGSVNQNGEIQAIGGVTQKIEGWFDICEARGLTGDQGVVIPAANAEDLMLRDKVVAAVADGRFHIWAVEHVDEGLAILTGQTPEAVHRAVADRLRQLAASLVEFSRED